jgi:hypothetical protein
MMSSLTGKVFVIGQHEIAPIPLAEIDISLDANGQKVLIQNKGY